MKEKIVIALGGNALGNSPKEQLELVKKTAKSIVDLVKLNYQVIVSHGNGPQVGDIHLKTDYPFAESGAMSQGYIGYHLQQAIKNELKLQGVKKEVVSLITQVLVDQNDEAFKNPTKPVGKFYTEEEIKQKGFSYIEDSGRGYRRVVPSPEPKQILELNSILDLLQKDTIVITCGGGGIPVVQKDGYYEGIEAVIDKDKTSAKLAKDIKAEKLIILTAVDKVCINFNKPNEQELNEINVELAYRYIKEGHFAKGSMLPKVQAALDFLKDIEGQVLITSLEKVAYAIKGQTGTVIRK